MYFDLSSSLVNDHEKQLAVQKLNLGSLWPCAKQSSKFINSKVDLNLDIPTGYHGFRLKM